MSGEHALGLNFGTTNSVAAVSDGGGAAELVRFAGEHATGNVFRSALCYWQDEDTRGGIAHEAGP
ncbi:MAG: Hsp70 family protein, partial [Sphingomonas sp.]